MIPKIFALLVLVLGVPVRFKYVWQASKIRRRKSARDVSRKFYIASWIVYIVQLVHNCFQRDWVDVAFWAVGLFTVGYCILMCYRYWHEELSVLGFLVDSFQDKEEGGFWR